MINLIKMLSVNLGEFDPMVPVATQPRFDDSDAADDTTDVADDAADAAETLHRRRRHFLGSGEILYYECTFAIHLCTALI